MIYLHLSWQPQPRDGNSCAFRIYWLRDVVVAFWVLPYAQVWRTQWYMFLYCFGILTYIRFMFNCLNMDSLFHICSLYCHISLSRDERFITLGHWNKISTTWKLWRCLIARVSAEKWEKKLGVCNEKISPIYWQILFLQSIHSTSFDFEIWCTDANY